MKNFFTHGIGKIIKWIFFILLAAYVVLVIVRVFQMFDADNTEAQVAKIHATKLQLSDVMGDNLPPDPGALADGTLAGVDANENGIRDDVELAIFEKYPNSAKTRAVLLQYALLIQLQPKLEINEYTATALAEEDSRSYDCIGNIVTSNNNDIEEIETYRKFVDEIQLNTENRQKLNENYTEYIRSFELKSGCDIDLDTLSN